MNHNTLFLAQITRIKTTAFKVTDNMMIEDNEIQDNTTQLSNEPMLTGPMFKAMLLNGLDAEKFLQGQVTLDVSKLDVSKLENGEANAGHYQASAICDLKGRIHFGIWLKRHSSDVIELVVASDQFDELQAHIKKYGAFSKFKLEAAEPVYLAIVDGKATFSLDEKNSLDDKHVSVEQWQQAAITQGQAWISAQTAGLFQPQELRLHQRGGVDYDKGCYLGQEIIARLWFRAAPKQWLHLIAGTGDTPVAGQKLDGDMDVVNVIATGLNEATHTSTDSWQALVVARPAKLAESGYTRLDLTEGLNGSVAREK